jgi:hypothetical protein
MTEPVALSVKQPWAALIAAGVKTVDVRTWVAARRGRIFIHAGKRPDDRPEAWAHVATPGLRAAAALVGGIVGEAELVGCREYATAEAFAADAAAHLNAPGWFAPPRLYGFEFRAARPVEFRTCKGLTMFFKVQEPRGTAVPRA